MARDRIEYKIGADSSQFRRELARASGSFEKFQRANRSSIRNLKNIGLSAAAGLAAVGTAAAAAATALSVKATRAAATFERAIVSAGAKSAATAEQLKAMEAAAIGAASGAEFSAQQAAEAMGFLAAAGFDVEQQMSALPGVLSLASAGELELAESADLASNVLSQFGFEVSELGRVNDVLVKAANSANTSVYQLGEALSYAGPAAAGAGISLEETVAMIGKLSDAGLQADRAGTGLQQIMAQLGTAGKKLGVDLNGTRIANLGLAGSLRELEKAGLNAQNAGEFFTTRAKTSLQAILLQGIPAVEGLDKALQNAGGTAEEVAAKKIDTLQGSINILQGNLDNLMIMLGQKFAPGIKVVADGLSGLAEHLRENDELLQKFADAMAWATTVAAGAAQGFGRVASALIIAAGALTGSYKEAKEAAAALNETLDRASGLATSFAAAVRTSKSNMTDLEAEILAVDTALRDSNTTVERRIELEKRLGELQQKQRQQNLEQLAGRVDPLANARASLTEYLDELTEQRAVIEREAEKLGVGVNALGTLGAVDYGQMTQREREHAEALRSQYQKIGLLASDTRQRIAATTVELERSVQAMEELESSGASDPGGIVPTPEAVGPKARSAGQSAGEEFASGFRGGFGTPDVLSAIALDTVAEKRGADMAASVLDGFNTYVESQTEAYEAGQKMFGQLTYGVDEMMAENERLAQRWSDIWDSASDRVVSVFSDSVGDAFLGVLEGNVDAVKDAVKGLIKEMVVLAAKAAILSAFEAASPGGSIPSALGFSSGGHVRGPGTSTSDSIPAYLSNDEYVVKAAAVRHWGVGYMDDINNMRTPSRKKFAAGGLVGGGGGSGGGGGGGIRIINIVDPSAIDSYMAGPAGERIVINHISQRSEEISRILP